MTHPIDKFFSLVNNNNSSGDETASCPGFELDSTFSGETDTTSVPVSIGKVVEDPSEPEPGGTVVAAAVFRPVKEYNGHGKLNITDESRRACAEVMLGYKFRKPRGDKKRWL